MQRSSIVSSWMKVNAPEIKVVTDLESEGGAFFLLELPSGKLRVCVRPAVLVAVTEHMDDEQFLDLLAAIHETALIILDITGGEVEFCDDLVFSEARDELQYQSPELRSLMDSAFSLEW